MQIWLNRLDGCTQLATLHGESFEQFLAEYELAGARLVCKGTHLTSDNFQSLLLEGANVYLTSDLDGGKKKKKKKVFTNKKKNKHIHKRVKLAVYSLYSVDGKGNVTQQRKTCPSCGPGTFMAQHWDRYYCGFCHTTIKMDAETIKKNEEIMKKKRAALEAEKKAKEKEAADKAPAGKGKKDAKKAAAGKKK
jgi:small subunit ribosomal protein S27Ae